MLTILIIDTKYAALFLSAYQLHLHLSDLSSSWVFSLSPSITFFYCTCYCCILSGMHYNDKKANKYRLSGLQLLLCMLCFYYAWLIVLEPRLTTNFFNLICMICKSSRISWPINVKELINIDPLACYHCCACFISVLCWQNSPHVKIDHQLFQLNLHYL